MLNTDRGADNYMIKYCDGEVGKSLVDVAPSRNIEMPQMTELRRAESTASSSTPQMCPGAPPAYSLRVGSAHGQPYTRQPHIHIAAIDN